MIKQCLATVTTNEHYIPTVELIMYVLYPRVTCTTKGDTSCHTGVLRTVYIN